MYIVRKNELLNAMDLVSKAMSSNAILPILDGFRFQFSGGRLTVSGSDLEVFVQSTINVEGNKDFACVVPKMLLSTIKSLSVDSFEIGVNEKSNAIVIISSNGKYSVPFDLDDDYPDMPDIDDSESFEISSSLLKAKINNVLFATSDDELRQAFTGVYFDAQKKGMAVVATDAHVLAVDKLADIKMKSSFIAPKKLLKIFVGKSSGDEITKVSISKTNVSFVSGDTIIRGRRIDAKYPEYTAVIPESFPSTMQVNRAELLGSLKRALLYANKTTSQIILGVTERTLKISSSDLDFGNEAQENISCVATAPIEIKVNGKYMQEICSIMSTTDVIISYSAPTKAIFIEPSDKSFSVLQMPLN